MVPQEDMATQYYEFFRDYPVDSGELNDPKLPGIGDVCEVIGKGDRGLTLLLENLSRAAPTARIPISAIDAFADPYYGKLPQSKAKKLR